MRRLELEFLMAKWPYLMILANLLVVTVLSIDKYAFFGGAAAALTALQVVVLASHYVHFRKEWLRRSGDAE